MDPKELKAMLKEAKDALKAKNFGEVVTKCKVSIEVISSLELVCMSEF